MLTVLAAAALLPQSGGLMTSEEYGKVKHTRPYVLRIRTKTATIVYFGIGHTRNPEDPQLKTAAGLWQDLKPQAVFNEDETPRPQATLDESVRANGETAWLAFKAKEDGIPIQSLDPGRAKEAETLTKQFDPEVVKSLYVLRNIYEYNKRPPERRTTPIASFAGLNLLRLTTIPTLGPKPANAAELQEVVEKIAGADSKWDEPPSAWFDPGLVEKRTVFNDICKASSYIRDLHMVERIVELAGQDKRVFIAMGASHVVMQEPAIRKRLPDAKVELLMGRE